MLHLLLVGSGDACVLLAVAGTAHSASVAADAGGMTGMAMPRHTAPRLRWEGDGTGLRDEQQHQQRVPFSRGA